MSSLSQDVSNFSNDRIAPTGSHSASHPQDLEFLTTTSGDVVYVQPSFDDSIDRPRSPTPSKWKAQERQSRSPNQEGNHGEPEPRNPSSPTTQDEDHQRRGHARNLSAHFVDAASLSTQVEDMEDGALVDKSHQGQRPRRKHRRLMSNDLSNPPAAHRRMTSSGASVAIERHRTGSRQHQRVDSAGLDILSAAVDASKDELALAAGADQTHEAPWGAPPGMMPPITSAVGQGGPYDHHPPYGAHPGSVTHHHMNPPHRRLPSYPQPYPVPYPSMPPQVPPYPPSHYPPYASSSYYVPGYSPHHRAAMPPPPPPQAYPLQYARPPPEVSSKAALFQSRRGEDRMEADESRFDNKGSTSGAAPGVASGTHQGSQTFVTAISTGSGNRMMQPSNAIKHASTSTEDYALSNTSVPSHVGHHRKLSSFSSLGTIVASSVFSPVPEKPAGSHHRATSSSISFLQGIDMALESTDEAFLRNLQASNSAAEFQDPPRPYADSKSASPASEDDMDDGSVNGSKLALGGTSKRIRRKCSIEGCANRVVQGGLCIAHGAKRKICKHPGCSKNVKKAGLCSSHGPARRRCDAEGCQKVAVQGGRCIAHGAKKRICSVAGCAKQAILAGMCKKHHDKLTLEGGEVKNEEFCQEVESSTTTTTNDSHRPSHTRGLSIFQDLSADDVQSLLGHEGNDPLKGAANVRRYGV